MSKMQALFGLGSGKNKATPATAAPTEAKRVIAMGEDEAKRRRMRAAASSGTGTIMGDAERLGG